MLSNVVAKDSWLMWVNFFTMTKITVLRVFMNCLLIVGLAHRNVALLDNLRRCDGWGQRRSFALFTSIHPINLSVYLFR